MPENSLTLNTLLGLPDKDFSDQVINASSDQGEETEPAQDRVSKGLHGLQRKVVEGEIRRKAGELLDVDVMEMMVSPWRGRKLIEHVHHESTDNDRPAPWPLLHPHIHPAPHTAIET